MYIYYTYIRINIFFPFPPPAYGGKLGLGKGEERYRGSNIRIIIER